MSNCGEVGKQGIHLDTHVNLESSLYSATKELVLKIQLIKLVGISWTLAASRMECTILIAPLLLGTDIVCARANCCRTSGPAFVMTSQLAFQEAPQEACLQWSPIPQGMLHFVLVQLAPRFSMELTEMNFRISSHWRGRDFGTYIMAPLPGRSIIYPTLNICWLCIFPGQRYHTNKFIIHKTQGWMVFPLTLLLWKER